MSSCGPTISLGYVSSRNPASLLTHYSLRSYISSRGSVGAKVAGQLGRSKPSRHGRSTGLARIDTGHDSSILHDPLYYKLASSLTCPRIRQDACVNTYETSSPGVLYLFVHDQHILNSLLSCYLPKPLFEAGYRPTPPLYTHGGGSCAAEDK
jgi:hypothetical protein